MSSRSSDGKTFNEELDELEKRFELHGDFASLSLASPTKHGWTDELCLKEGQKCCKWNKIPENEREGQLINFVNLWFSTANSDYKQIRPTVRNALLMFPLGLSNKLLLQDVFDSAIETAQAPPATNDKEAVIEEPIVDQLNYKQKADVSAFHNWLKQKFSLLKFTKDNIPTEYKRISRQLRTVVGFCALILMRFIKKNMVQVTRYFPYGASKTFDLLFPEIGLNVSLVPTPTFLKHAESALSSHGCNRESAEIFHLLVFQYLKSTVKADASSRFVKQILEEGCLNVTKGNGMGLVTMFQDVKQLYGNIEERYLLSFIAGGNENFRRSEKLLMKFLEIYAQQDKPQYSWKWARIISQNYFSDLNIRSNQWMCCRFAVLLLDKNPGIFGHKELDAESVWAEFANIWAVKAKKALKKLNDQ